MTSPPSQVFSSRGFYSSSIGSPILSISSSSFHSSIFPPSSSTTSQTAVSLPFAPSAGFTYFYYFQFLSNLCQYCLSYSPSDHPNKLLVVMGVTKVRLVISGCVFLSETRVISANHSSVISEMGHSCMQTSRHWRVSQTSFGRISTNNGSFSTI